MLTSDALVFARILSAGLSKVRQPAHGEWPNEFIPMTLRGVPHGILASTPGERGDVWARFVRTPYAEHMGHSVVLADVGKMDAAWRRSSGHVGPPGHPTDDPGGRAGAVGAIAGGKDVHMPEVRLGHGGVLEVADGGHMLAAMRDAGMGHIPVAVPREHERTVRSLYGHPSARPIRMPRKYAPGGPHPFSFRPPIHDEPTRVSMSLAMDPGWSVW